MNHSQEIRNYVRAKYVEPAILHGEPMVKVRAGDIHKQMRLRNRQPMVCQALASKLFLEENNLILESKEGPPSGLSTSVVFTYRIAKDEKPQPSIAKFQGLMQLSGKGKDVFAALGGGEAFLLGERRALNASMNESMNESMRPGEGTTGQRGPDQRGPDQRDPDQRDPNQREL